MSNPPRIRILGSGSDLETRHLGVATNVPQNSEVLILKWEILSWSQNLDLQDYK